MTEESDLEDNDSDAQVLCLHKLPWRSAGKMHNCREYNASINITYNHCSIFYIAADAFMKVLDERWSKRTGSRSFIVPRMKRVEGTLYPLLLLL